MSSAGLLIAHVEDKAAACIARGGVSWHSFLKQSASGKNGGGHNHVGFFLFMDTTRNNTNVSSYSVGFIFIYFF